MNPCYRAPLLVALFFALAACDCDREQRMILDQAAKLESAGHPYEAHASYEAAKRYDPGSELGRQAAAESSRMSKKLWGRP